MKGILFSLLKEVARKHQKPLTVGIKEQKLFHCLPLKDPEGLNNRGNLYTDDSLQRRGANILNCKNYSFTFLWQFAKQ